MGMKCLHRQVKSLNFLQIDPQTFLITKKWSTFRHIQRILVIIYYIHKRRIIVKHLQCFTKSLRGGSLYNMIGIGYSKDILWQMKVLMFNIFGGPLEWQVIDPTVNTILSPLTCHQLAEARHRYYLSGIGIGSMNLHQIFWFTPVLLQGANKTCASCGIPM